MKKRPLTLVPSPERLHFPYRRTGRVPYAVDPLLPNSRLQAIKKLLGERVERGEWWRRWLR
jgi:hypothetical protein